MSQSFIQFCSGLDKHINKTFTDLLEKSSAEEQDLIARTFRQHRRKKKIPVPEVNSEVVLTYPKIYSFRVWVKYAILSWYLSPYTQFELQEVLRKKAEQLHFLTSENYLHSKEICCYSLFRELDVTHSDLFGNLLTQGTREWILDATGKKVKIVRPDKVFLKNRSQRTPKKKVFRRGYKDHGSLPDLDKIARKEADMSTSAEQYEIELKRNNEKLTRSLNLLKFLKMLEEEGID